MNDKYKTLFFSKKVRWAPIQYRYKQGNTNIEPCWSWPNSNPASCFLYSGQPDVSGKRSCQVRATLKPRFRRWGLDYDTRWGLVTSSTVVATKNWGQMESHSKVRRRRRKTTQGENIFRGEGFFLSVKNVQYFFRASEMVFKSSVLN